MSPKTKVMTASQEDGVIIAIHGQGCMANSLAIFNYIKGCVEASAKEICFDMTGLTSMDSTFMGTLMQVNELAQKINGDLFLLNVSPENQAKLAELGLTSFMDVTRQADIPEVDMEELDVKSGESMERVRHILAAHEKLVTQGEGNREKFGRFIQLLKEDLKKYGDDEQKG